VRQICHFFRADPAYGIGVAKVLGIDLDEFMPDGAVHSEALVGKH
jgi:catalase